MNLDWRENENFLFGEIKWRQETIRQCQHMFTAYQGVAVMSSAKLVLICLASLQLGQ